MLKCFVGHRRYIGVCRFVGLRRVVGLCCHPEPKAKDLGQIHVSAALKKPQRRLGIHIRTAGGLLKGARHAADIGCTTFQIMSGNPSAWNPGVLDPGLGAGFGAYLDEHDIRPVFLHAGYLINLSCRSGRNAPIYAKSVKLLQANIDRAEALTCEYVVFHLGSRRGSGVDESLAALIGGLARLRVSWTALLIENGAGSGDTVGSTLAELAAVLDAAAARGIEAPLGVCLDTAHMWGAGYDLSSAAAARRVVKEFDETVGIDRLKLIHFNDSPVARGSLKDRHEHIGRGVMTREGLRAIARHPRLGQVPLILETPGAENPSDEERMRDLREIAGVKG